MINVFWLLTTIKFFSPYISPFLIFRIWILVLYLKDTEQSLDTRIERRRSELERNQKRLQTLRKVRPAFMEEYEKLEAELRILYDDYLQKFRYLSYLEHLHEDAAKAEQERIEKR